MAVYLITYDLNNEARRPPIVERIKKWKKHVQLSESSYAIVSSEEPDAVRQKLKSFFDDDDQLWVISMRHPYSGYGLETTIAWLDEHLPEE